jgi:hypothetical protein
MSMETSGTEIQRKRRMKRQSKISKSCVTVTTMCIMGIEQGQKEKEYQGLFLNQ